MLKLGLTISIIIQQHIWLVLHHQGQFCIYLQVGMVVFQTNKSVLIQTSLMRFNGWLYFGRQGVYLQRRVGVSRCYTERFTFYKRKSWLSGKEVDTSRQLSDVRIHAERVIGQVNKFRILQNIIPILTQIDLLYDIMVIVCGIINLNKNIFL